MPKIIRYKYFASSAALVVAIFAFFNLFSGNSKTPDIGDATLIPWILANPASAPTPKYLVGIELLRAGYSAIWKFPPIHHHLGPSFNSPKAYLSFLAITIMLASSLWLMGRAHLKARVLLPLSTPIWLLCSVGYTEYYPFIIGLFLFFLLYISEAPLQTRKEHVIGAICGVLPTIYFGFTPIAILLFACYALNGWQRFHKTFGWSLFSFLISISLFWKGNLSSYFDTLYSDLNFGTKNTVYSAYAPYAAGESSIFFDIRYVFTIEHLAETGMMLLKGSGGTLLFLWAPFVLLFRRQFEFSRTNLFLASCLAWEVYYFLFMLPKYGPDKDVDLFFQTYTVIAFVCGAATEKIMRMEHQLVALSLAFTLSAFTLFYQLH